MLRWIIVGTIVALTGCASAEPQRLVVDPSTDPAWIPPGEGQLSIADRPEPSTPKAKPRARKLQQPNHREMDSKLQARVTQPRS